MSETLSEFFYIPPIRNTIQSNSVRLYREARSSTSVYHSILFYWHILSYPDHRDEEAVSYLDGLQESDALRSSGAVQRICGNPIMLKDSSAFRSIGTYIRHGVRNSIAHFVRNPTYGEKSLVLDNFEQTRHLNDVNTLLRFAARHRIENPFELNEPHDLKVFCYTRHSDARNETDDVSRS